MRTVSRAAQLTGMIFTGLVGVVFIADLAAAVPFQRVSVALDVGMAVAAVIVTYLLWAAGAARR